VSETQCSLIAQVLPVFMLAISIRPLVFRFLLRTALTTVRTGSAVVDLVWRALVEVLMKTPHFDPVVRVMHALWVALLLTLAGVAEVAAVIGTGTDSGLGDFWTAVLWVSLGAVMLDFILGITVGVLLYEGAGNDAPPAIGRSSARSPRSALRSSAQVRPMRAKGRQVGVSK